MNLDRTKLRAGLVGATVLVANLAVTATAYASEAAAEGAKGAEAGGGGMGAIMPNVGELIPALVSFVILLAIMWKFALPTVTKNLDERQERIRESLERAEETRIEAERLLAEYKTQMAEARQEASKLLADSRKAAENIKDDIVAKANAEAEGMLEKAKISIDMEKQAAIAELQSSVADLSVKVAGRIIGETVTVDQHKALIEKALQESGGLNAN